MGLIKPYMGAVDTRAQRAVGEKARIDKDEIVRELVNYGARCTETGGIRSPVQAVRNTWGPTGSMRNSYGSADESGATFDFLADELSVYGIKHVAEYDVGHGHHGPFKSFPRTQSYSCPSARAGLSP